MICYRRDGKPSRPNNHKKNRRHHSGQSREYHQDQSQINCHDINTWTSDHYGGISPSPASSAPLLFLECALEPPITQAEIRTRDSLAHSVPANDSSTVVRHTRPVRQRHCRGHPFCFQKMFVYLLLACPIMQHKLPLSRAHGLLRRLSAILMAWYRWREPALRAWFPSARYCFDNENARFKRRFPHSLSLATGTRVFSAFPLNRGINSAMGVRAPNAAPFNHGKGACALRAPPRHASCRNTAAVTARRLFRRRCSFSPPP